MLLNLVVKGKSKAAAVAAAKKRGFTDCKAWHRTDSTVAVLAEGEWNQAATWLAEPAELKKGVGFPDGTLLHFCRG